jgi:hypothetical protein
MKYLLDSIQFSRTQVHVSTCACIRHRVYLDLALPSPGLAIELEWSALPDLHSSDHCSVNVRMPTLPLTVWRHPTRITGRASWPDFCQSFT